MISYRNYPKFTNLPLKVSRHETLTFHGVKLEVANLYNFDKIYIYIYIYIMDVCCVQMHVHIYIYIYILVDIHLYI